MKKMKVFEQDVNIENGLSLSKEKRRMA